MLWAITLFFQIIHLLYHQITTNVNFFPFNNIGSYTFKLRLAECLSSGIVMSIPIIATLLNNRVTIGISLGCLALLLVGEYFTWWHPYFFGPRPIWKEAYNRKFKNTIIILPPIKDHPIPNLEHVILHGLTLITFILTAALFING